MKFENLISRDRLQKVLIQKNGTDLFLSYLLTLIPLNAAVVETADSIEIRRRVLGVVSRANLFDTQTIFATNIG